MECMEKTNFKMRKGSVTTRFGEISFINFEGCYVGFCKSGSAGTKGCFSLTFKEIDEIVNSNNILPLINLRYNAESRKI